MKRIYVQGIGAVSPAGWGLDALRRVIQADEPLPTQTIPPPSPLHGQPVRRVPPLSSRPPFLLHPRLRRTSPISHFAVAAALEALGQTGGAGPWTGDRLGIIYCTLCGGVVYTRRFYSEVLENPLTASPLVFPETVFNAPSSHLAALLQVSTINYSLVGDQSAFGVGLVLAARWLQEGRVDGCLIVGAEEVDWTSAVAWQFFARGVPLAEGAGAVYLRAEPSAPPWGELDRVTSPEPYSPSQPPSQAIRRLRTEIPHAVPGECLVNSRGGQRALDHAEAKAWSDWAGPQWSPKRLLGEGLMAASAWQCAVAVDLLRSGQAPAATVSVVGANAAAIGLRFLACPAAANATGSAS